MSDLPLRQQLAQAFHITAPTVARKQESRLDGTIKYLWELADGNCIETVLMQYHHGNTVCISSQVGCRMGCAFCASTIGRKGPGPDRRGRCWTRCCSPSWIPAGRSPISC